MDGYEWDPAKEHENIRKHGMDFSSLDRFEWDIALIETDDRENYGELREVAVSFIGDVPHVLVFTRRSDDSVRVISLRKATRQERRRYAQSIE